MALAGHWQDVQGDVAHRRALIQHIYRLFAARKPNVTQEWQERLPDFVKRLEEALYRNAGSKEEYSDITTLEQRLQQVARTFVSSKNNRQQQAQQQQQRPASAGPPGSQGGSAPSASTAAPSVLLQQQQGQQLFPGQVPGGLQRNAMLNGLGGPGSLMPGAGMPYQMASAALVANGMSGLGSRAMPGIGPQAQPLMSSPALGQPGIDPGMGLIGMSPLQQQQAAALRSQAASPASLMGNGKPLPAGVLRGSAARDQATGPQSSLGGSTAVPHQARGLVNGLTPQMQLGLGGQMHASAAQAGVMPKAMQLQMQQRLRGANGMMGSMMPGAGMMALNGQPGSSHMGSMMPMMAQHHHTNGLMPGSDGGEMVPVNNAPALNGLSGSAAASPSLSGQNSGVVPNLGGMPSGGLPSMNLQALGSQQGIGSQPMIFGGMQLSGADGAMTQDQQQPSQQQASQHQQHAQAQAQHQHQQAAQQQQQQQAETNARLKKEYIIKQQRWLLFLRHCAKCQFPDGQCSYGSSCAVAKQLWQHILSCSDQNCEYPRCVASRELLKHHQKCISPECLICVPVKQHVQTQRMAAHLQQQQRAAAAAQDPALQQQLFQQQKALLQHGAASQQQMMAGMLQGMQPAMMLRNGMHPAQAAAAAGASPSGTGVNPGAIMMPNGIRRMDQQLQGAASKRPKVALEGNQGTSLLEAFSAQEIETHLQMLRTRPGTAEKINPEDDNQCRACGERRLTFEPPSLYCSGCGQRIKRNQVYWSQPLNQTAEIKGYWCHGCYQDQKGDSIDMDGTRVKKVDLEKRKNDDEQEEGWVQCDLCSAWVHMICGLFNKGRNTDEMPYHCPECLLGGLLRGSRQPIGVRPQAMLEAKDLPVCELSEFLQHRLNIAVQNEHLERAKQAGAAHHSQVPSLDALFIRVVNNVNKRTEVKPRFWDAFKPEGSSESYPYRQKVILLFQKLDGVDVCLYCLYMQEYNEDCPAPNKRWVYLSYLDSVKYFRPEHEAAATCGQYHLRTFETSRPAAGRNMALRTMVYHEVMVGYLDYIKRRGYTSMFIWACPPLQGDDYIMYCHPHRQKTPRSDRLREWYHALLRQAKQEGIVTYISNLYDTFFEGGKDHRVERPSATHLPYFEGDYWPGEAEAVLANYEEQQRQAGRNRQGGSASGKARSKQNAKGKRFGHGTADDQLMTKLGENIQGMKDDFIVVHLQEPCSFCREYISDAPRYYHPSPPHRTVKNERTFEGISLDNPGQSSNRVLPLSRFQLCATCYQREQAGGAKAKGLPAGVRLEDLQMVKVEAIPSTLPDYNPDMDCQFFHTRQAFLSLCQGNHYQFDTIRRAKHSSAMVLYHLHNPDAPAFASTCNRCNAEIEPGAGFRCTTCSDYDVCKKCYSSGQVEHPHPLVAQARRIDETRMRLSDQERRDRAQQLQRTMLLLVHASNCKDANCSSSHCGKVKNLFHHAATCQKKIAGGCPLCRRMWALLQLHAKQCQISDCPVPRCRELREMRKRQMSRQEEQRRRAYQAMLQHQHQSQANSQAGQ